MSEELCVCFYHPPPSFQSITEHIAVAVDTPGKSGDMGLVALFGASQAAGATPEQAEEARQQAQLFVASKDLLAALKQLMEEITPALQKSYPKSEWMHGWDYAERVIAKAEGREP